MESNLFDKTVSHFVEDIRGYFTHTIDWDLVKEGTADSLAYILSLDPLLPDLGHVERILLWQLVALHKRYIGPCRYTHCFTDEVREKAAWDTFVSTNQKGSSYNDLDGPGCVFTTRPVEFVGEFKRTRAILETAQRVIEVWLQDGCCFSPSLEEVAHGLRPGPGKSAGVPHQDAFRKIAEGPATAKDLMTSHLWQALSSTTPTSLEAERTRASIWGPPVINVRAQWTSVPKSVVTDRGIAIEPSCNTMLQLAFASLLVRALRRAGIDLQTQQKINADLAAVGSASGLFGTMDLSSASDSVWVELVRFLFPREWFNWLMTVRSAQCEYNGNVVDMQMIGTMGNGFTFPLETIVFAALTHATYQYMGIRTHDRQQRLNYAVYGDDIIVFGRVFSLLQQTLEHCGFTVNGSKSFNSGLFRESCGKDFFAGEPVRPVFVENIETVQDRISFINRLARWGARHGIALRRTFTFLTGTIPRKVRFGVPAWEQDDAGIHTSRPGLGSTPRTGAAVDKLVGRQLGAQLYAKFKVKEVTYPLWRLNYTKLKLSWLLQKPVRYLGYNGKTTGVVVRDTWYSGRVDVQLRCHEVIDHLYVNPAGALLSVLGGYVSETGVTVRPRTVSYEIVEFNLAPGWGVGPDDPRFGGWQAATCVWNAYVGEFVEPGLAQ